MADRSAGSPSPAASALNTARDFTIPAPRAVRTPAPEYPEEARWERRTGLATLGFRLESDGSVAEIRLLHSSGHRDLDTAAMDALRHWRFVRPADADAVDWYRYVFRFELT